MQYLCSYHGELFKKLLKEWNLSEVLFRSLNTVILVGVLTLDFIQYIFMQFFIRFIHLFHVSYKYIIIQSLAIRQGVNRYMRVSCVLISC